MMYALCEVETAGELIVEKLVPAAHVFTAIRSKPALAGTVAIPIDSTYHGTLKYYRVITNDFIGWIRASSLCLLASASESMGR